MELISSLILSLTVLSVPIASPSIEQTMTDPILAHDKIDLNPSYFHSIVDPVLYFGAGACFGTASLLSGFGWGLLHFFPGTKPISNDFLIAAELFETASMHCFERCFEISPLSSLFFSQIKSSYSAWHHNKQLLDQIPILNDSDQQLIQFLQRRWLAKVTGTYPFLIDWICPAFGISYQAHPETTNAYARDPSNKYSDTYLQRILAWKQHLAHPESFPLILTRPAPIDHYLPFLICFTGQESLEDGIKKAKSLKLEKDQPLAIDLSNYLPAPEGNSADWLAAWQQLENELLGLLSQEKIDYQNVVCIQKIKEKQVWGIRILPFTKSSSELNAKHSFFLLEWISRFGLSATRIELDRLPYCLSKAENQEKHTTVPLLQKPDPALWISTLDRIDQRFQSEHPQKMQMVKGTIHVLKNLCASIKRAKWEEISQSPTHIKLAQLCFLKIIEQLNLMIEEEAHSSFHESMTHLEQVHADIASLLEIFSPFTTDDFLSAFRSHLTCIPEDLKPFTHYALHTCAMGTLGAIFKAAQQFKKGPLKVLFGDNTYFECINAAEHISDAKLLSDANEEDWKQVDVILAQFNPTVKRINFEITEYQATEYHAEKIAEYLHKALKAKNGDPLTLALDFTLDYSNSSRNEKIMKEFSEEIRNGSLNLIFYRSGLKFDLFGMDNYCGAPLFMLHNTDPKWSTFDPLISDPILQTDLLSTNWYTLAYQTSTAYLDWYTKQIFDNTRAVLDRIPKHLYSKENTRYRVVPIDQDADPTFVDIKIFGPLHQLRGELLVAVFLTLKSMQAGYPLLFRPGIGFYHPNLAVLFGKECTTIRLTIGLDPAQVDVMVRCLEKIETANYSLATK